MSLGVYELDSGEEPLGRVRRPGGGRKRAVDMDPGLCPALLALVEPEERGDPMSPLRWTTKSTRNLAAELTRQGHRVGAIPLVTCCGTRGSACRATPRPSRASGTRTAMRSSGTSASRSRPPGHRGPGGQRGHQEEGECRPVQERPPRWRPGRAAATRKHDFPEEQLGKALPTASMTSPLMPAGSMSAPTMTPPRSQWSRYAAGQRPGPGDYPRPGGC